MLQLHCPPTDVYYAPEVFGVLDDLVRDGKLKHYGVSVEKVEEAIKAIEFPGVVSVQIIFNMFRLRPSELLFDLAQRHGVAIIARVPLASGLLSGKFTSASVFSANDHRKYNRSGEAFDVGETFSGVPYDAGLHAVEELRTLLPPGLTMAQFALRWILMFDAVSVAIPGAKNREQGGGQFRRRCCRRARSGHHAASRGTLRRAGPGTGASALVRRTRTEAGMGRENRLRTTLLGGGQAIGIWLQSGEPAFAEIAGLAGLDFFIVDLEHGPGDVRTVTDMMRAASGTTATGIVRVPSSEPITIRRMLDAGAAGVLVPMVETADEAQRVVDACRYPPRGRRGMATDVVRGADYGLDVGYLRHAHEQVLVAVQIENPRRCCQCARHRCNRWRGPDLRRSQ